MGKCVQRMKGKKGIKYSLILTSFSVFLLGISIFLPGWRSDSIGTTPLVGDYLITGFDWKDYGLIQSRATITRAWSTITNEVCNFAAIGQISQGVAIVNNNAKGNVQGCSGRESCMNGFHIHMQARCVGYQKIMKISFISMALTGVSVLMGIIGSLLAALASKKKIGGVTFGLYLAAVFFSAIANVVWCIMTDMVFKDLAKTAWYPYPSLSWAWYMNVVAIALLLVGDIWFGYLVLPQVWKYDPTQEKLDKRNRKQQMYMNKQAAAGMYGQQGPAGFQGQGMYVGGTVPAPPGFQQGFQPQQMQQPQQVQQQHMQQQQQQQYAQQAGFLSNQQALYQGQAQDQNFNAGGGGGFQGVAYPAGGHPGAAPFQGGGYQVSPQPAPQQYAAPQQYGQFGQGDMRSSGMAVRAPHSH